MLTSARGCRKRIQGHFRQFCDFVEECWEHGTLVPDYVRVHGEPIFLRPLQDDLVQLAQAGDIPDQYVTILLEVIQTFFLAQTPGTQPTPENMVTVLYAIAMVCQVDCGSATQKLQTSLINHLRPTTWFYTRLQPWVNAFLVAIRITILVCQREEGLPLFVEILIQRAQSELRAAAGVHGVEHGVGAGGDVGRGGRGGVSGGFRGHTARTRTPACRRTSGSSMGLRIRLVMVEVAARRVQRLMQRGRALRSLEGRDLT